MTFITFAYVGSPRQISHSIVLAVGTGLEDRFHRTQLANAARNIGIVVLGGSALRVQEGLRLATMYPNAPLILSGCDPYGVRMAQANSDIANRLIVDARPTNTYENGRYSAEFIRAAPKKRWVLVTSGFHMPRAAGVFSKLGLNVLYWPVSDLQHYSVDRQIKYVAHEIFSLAAYWFLGRTTELLPGPQQNNGRLMSEKKVAVQLTGA